MTAPEVGLWALSVLGVLTVATGLLISVSRQEVSRTLVVTLFFFGVLMLGLTVYGINFMDKYRELMQTVLPMLEDPGPASYEKALEETASGRLSPQNREIVRAIAVARPIAGLDSIVGAITQRATDPAGGETLTRLSRDLDARDAQASSVVRHWSTMGTVEAAAFDTLDASLRPLVARKLLTDQSMAAFLNPSLRRQLTAAATIDSIRRRQ